MKPVDLAAHLNTKRDEIAELVPNFDTEYTIVGTEFPKYTPKFVGNISVSTFNQYNVTLVSQLDNFGWIAAVAIKQSENTGKPSA